MTDKVEKLERAALRDPVRIAVNTKYQTVDQLSQEYLFFPAKMKDVYLAYIMEQKIGKDIIIFTLTCLAANKVCLLLRKLGHKVVTVNGQMSQAKRLGSLARFRQRDANILVATDVASRGLDIPSVDLVVNYDLPMNPKDYIHRVGRTARAGKGGRSISFITQYDIEEVQKIETLIGKKLQQYSGGQGDIESSVMAIQEMVQEKVRIANDELKLKMEKRGVDEEKEGEKYEKYGKKIQKKKLRNKKKRVTVDV